jgi:hypothetical protein
MTRYKEVATNVPVWGTLNFEEELSIDIFVGGDLVHVVQVEEVHTTNLFEIPPPSWCGMISSNVIVTDKVLNSNVAHYLTI